MSAEPLRRPGRPDPTTSRSRFAGRRRAAALLESSSACTWTRRDQGWTWQNIATALQVSRQSVHEKHATAVQDTGRRTDMFERFTELAKRPWWRPRRGPVHGARLHRHRASAARLAQTAAPGRGARDHRVELRQARSRPPRRCKKPVIPRPGVAGEKRLASIGIGRRRKSTPRRRHFGPGFPLPTASVHSPRTRPCNSPCARPPPSGTSRSTATCCSVLAEGDGVGVQSSPHTRLRHGSSAGKRS